MKAGAGITLEHVVDLLALAFSVAAFLDSAYVLGVLALVMGGVSFGILLGRRE